MFSSMEQFDEAVSVVESVVGTLVQSIPYKVSDDAPSTFKGIKDWYNKHGYFLIYGGNSDTTIFTSPEINIKFRAFHDHGHYKYNLSFSFEDEKTLGKIQAVEVYNKALAMGYPNALAMKAYYIILAEINGQIEYYEKYRKYLENQKEYILKYLNVKGT